MLDQSALECLNQIGQIHSAWFSFMKSPPAFSQWGGRPLTLQRGD
ncbi:hypothetical protein BGLA2_60094 [Burkholderia gladioli]|nr:hypothetical protein BGLA2_60094 [Burkholderia gladioli]